MHLCPGPGHEQRAIVTHRPPPTDVNWSPTQVECRSNPEAGVGKGRPGEAQVTRGRETGGTDGQESTSKRQEGVGRQDCSRVKALSPWAHAPLFH